MQSWIDSLGVVELALGCAAFCMSCTALGLAMGWAAERIAWRRGRKVFDVPHKRGQLRTEATGTVLFHLVFVPLLVTALATGAIRFEASAGWGTQALSFWAPWIVFQIFYYGMHRSLHHRRLFWVHRWHHESLVTTPLTGLSMHPVEAVGWTVGLLVPAIVLSRFEMLGAIGWLSFLGVHWVGNIAGHANADFFPTRVSRTASLFAPPVSYHSLHHARFDGHYGFAAAYMDRLFGTEWADWKELHDRVWDGRPLESLRVRGVAKSS